MTETTDLSQIAADIRAEWRRATETATSAIYLAASVGSMLVKAKAAVRHGQWRTWVEDNCPFGDRQARKLMRLVREWNRIEEANRNSGSDLGTINEALALIAEPQPVRIPRPGADECSITLTTDAQYAVLIWLRSVEQDRRYYVVEAVRLDTDEDSHFTGRGVNGHSLEFCVACYLRLAGCRNPDLDEWVVVDAARVPVPPPPWVRSVPEGMR